MPKHIMRLSSIAFALLLACDNGNKGNEPDKDEGDKDRTGAQGTPSSNLPANTRPVAEPGGSNREMNPGSMRTPPEPGGAGQPGSNDKPDPAMGSKAPTDAKPPGGTTPDNTGGNTGAQPPGS